MRVLANGNPGEQSAYQQSGFGVQEMRTLEKEEEIQKEMARSWKNRKQGRQINKVSFAKLDFCGIHLQNL
jgi:hypothetical protein